MTTESEFTALWPNHCRTCCGGGWFANTYAGHGVVYDDPCGACIDADICPRCGDDLTRIFDDAGDYEFCHACGYSSANDDMARPQYDVWPDWPEEAT